MKGKTKLVEKPRPKGFDLGDVLVHIIAKVDNLEKESAEEPRDYLASSVMLLIKRIEDREVRQTQNPVTKSNIIKLGELMRKFKVPRSVPKEFFSCIDIRGIYPSELLLTAGGEVIANLSMITTFLTEKSSVCGGLFCI